MKCFKHLVTDAVAICAYCGKGLCRECALSPSPPRIVCSTECGEALVRDAKATQMLLQQSARNAGASAVYCYLGAGLSAGGAIIAWFILPSPFLILFAAGCAFVLLVSGIWYSRAASGFRKSNKRAG